MSVRCVHRMPHPLAGAMAAAALLLHVAIANVQAEDNAEQSIARGVVYHDVNNNRRWDEGDQPLSGMRVSNGRTVSKTDEQGKYEIPVDDDDIVFVIKPRGYRTPLSAQQLPQFFYIHKPHGSPELKFSGVSPTGQLPSSIDFPLYPQEEPDEFRAVLFGDPQPRNQQEVDYIAHDVVQELIGTDASFGVTLGDIAFNDLSTFDALNQTVALIGIPWYNVIGNHDINFDARHDRYSDETFERVYGPSYYSFDYGQAHFIVLDDIEWIPPEGTKDGRYQGGLGPEQIEFVRNDLALVPDEQLVVLMMHIPLVNVGDRQELYRLIEQRPFCISISGHMHHHEHRFIDSVDGWRGPQPHHHIINVTVCGSWWSGTPDERGIPHATMADGAPNGYSIITFDGTKYQLQYKAAGRPADYQMQIHLPDAVDLHKRAETPVYVNVFNGSEKSKVELQVGNGSWQLMERTLEFDPRYQNVQAEEEAALAGGKHWRALPKPYRSTHLWKAMLPADIPVGTHLVRVRTTDMHGQTFAAHRVVRIVDQGPDIAGAGSVTANSND